MAQFIQLIPIVEAQSLDTISQPTFGTITVSGGGGVTASVLLTSDKSSVKVGDTFTVKINVKTNTLSISEYKIVISYDKSLLSVIDQDTTTAGTQIKLLDDVFTIADPAKDNLVSTTGQITIDAKTTSGNSFQVNKDVAEIQFQAQAEGISTLKVTQGASGTQLIRSNGNSLTFTTNEVSVQSSTTVATNGGGTPINTPTPTPTPTPQPSQVVSQIPNTGIKEDITSMSGVFVGLLLVATGLLMAKNKLTPKKSRNNLQNHSW